MVTGITSTGGSGYTSPPIVTIDAPDTQAMASAVLNPSTNMLSSITLNLGGDGYLSAPNVTLSGGGGVQAVANATPNGQHQITAITVTNAGTGYSSTSPPNIVIVGSGRRIGCGAVPHGLRRDDYPDHDYQCRAGLHLESDGHDRSPSRTRGKATASVVNGVVIGFTINTFGSGYISIPTRHDRPRPRRQRPKRPAR